MKFDQLVKLYETKQTGPPYIKKDTYGGTRLKNSVFYYKDPEYKILHREDGPAQIWTMKTNEPPTTAWWVNGKRHRIGGPAYENGLGDVEWFVDNVRHREDGPAVTRVNGTKATKTWWINGILLTPTEVKEHKKKLAVKKEIQSHKNNRIDAGMLEDYL